MNNPELIEDYLIDRNEGMKNVITWFLNQVMQQEALNQINAQPYERTVHRRARRNGIRKRALKTIPGEVLLDKLNLEKFLFRHKYSIDILA
jgi:transposase-like protein